MKKLVLASVLLIGFIISTAFSFKKEKVRSHYTEQPEATPTVLPFVVNDADYIPGYGKSYIGFKEAIAFKESQGKYFRINTLGYLGKYQFGSTTLATLRIFNLDYFLYNSKLQEKAFKANCSYNKWLLQKEINQYSGTVINGITITESGILAAAHLSGAGSVKRYLRKNGKGRRIVDAYGTGIEQYLKNYAGYDLSWIKATKYPKL
jgi:hypothetical protein